MLSTTSYIPELVTLLQYKRWKQNLRGGVVVYAEIFSRSDIRVIGVVHRLFHGRIAVQHSAGIVELDRGLGSERLSGGGPGAANDRYRHIQRQEFA